MPRKKDRKIMKQKVYRLGYNSNKFYFASMRFFRKYMSYCLSHLYGRREIILEKYGRPEYVVLRFRDYQALTKMRSILIKDDLELRFGGYGSGQEDWD